MLPNSTKITIWLCRCDEFSKLTIDCNSNLNAISNWKLKWCQWGALQSFGAYCIEYSVFHGIENIFQNASEWERANERNEWKKIHTKGASGWFLFLFSTSNSHSQFNLWICIEWQCFWMDQQFRLNRFITVALQSMGGYIYCFIRWKNVSIPSVEQLVWINVNFSEIAGIAEQNQW